MFGHLIKYLNICFISETTISSQSLKNRAAAKAWRNLTNEEKTEYNKQAKASSDIDPKKLTSEEKSKIITTHLKQIVKEVIIIAKCINDTIAKIPSFKLQQCPKISINH
jgi:hypothetical protein